MIVILGGGGFIGQHLRQRLLAAATAFTVVSPRPLRVRRSTASCEQFMLAEAFEGREGNALLRRASVLVNLASRSVPGTYAGQPWREVEERVAPAVALFGRCAELNPKLRLVQISSGGTVYGRIDQDNVNETAVCAPISAYGLAHVMTEEAIRFVGRTSGLPFCILRVSNPVGRFQSSPHQGIVSIAARAAMSGTEFSLFGDGLQIRDYLDADDVADAILLACLDRSHSDATWNVGSELGRSVLDVIRMVEKVSRHTIRLRQLPDRGIDVPRIVLDCGLIRSNLGWRPHRNIEGTIAQILQSLMTDSSIADAAMTDNARVVSR
jgi:UDP-glucose 4-epimerase